MQLSQTFQHSFANRPFQIAVVAIIAFGLLLRASKYLPGFSMRGDELAVTQNLIDRSAPELMTRPLDYEQAAPFGFVLLVKTLITALGTSEYVLRLVAFLGGCASLLLTQNLLAKTVRGAGTLFAPAAFASSNYLSYYAAELKQYSTDALLTLILLLAFQKHILWSGRTTPETPGNIRRKYPLSRLGSGSGSPFPSWTKCESAGA